MSQNQCMGCQAGWPKKEVPRFGAVTNPYKMYIHLVQGGYPYEIMFCTASSYGYKCKSCNNDMVEVDKDFGGYVVIYKDGVTPLGCLRCCGEA